MNDGLKRQRDDVVPLVYAPLPDDLLSDESDEDSELRNDLELISSSSPPRKRQRTSDWQPPAHIPNFLPPFPNSSNNIRPTSPRSPRESPSQPPPLKIEKQTSPLPQPSTPTYASDYSTSVPYFQSSLSSMPEWHLPSSRPPRVTQQQLPRLPTPQTQKSLLSAYHHILTHPPPPTANSANPSRHKVAMALLGLTQTHSRWEPPDTLYSSSAPCPPRITAIGPTFPILIGEISHPPGDQKASDAERERKANLPVFPPRPVFLNERITSLITQQSSRIPELARHVLPVRYSDFSRAYTYSICPSFRDLCILEQPDLAILLHYTGTSPIHSHLRDLYTVLV